jgi:LmbE family N-acetylglucosaminyl deacetylase
MSAILAIHAHPDDIEILAGGTLALLRGLGHHVAIITATAGEGGSADQPPEVIADIRKREAGRSAAVIGADYRCLGLSDLAVFNDDASRRIVTEALRAARPSIVLAPSPVDYHPDHEVVSVLVRDACFAASVPNYRTGPASALDAIPHLYFMDPIGGRDRDGRPSPVDFAVDVGAVFAKKRAMLAAHESQNVWVARQHDIVDQSASMEAWTRKRGRDFGVELAEGFRQYRHHPYPAAPALQGLVASALLIRQGELGADALEGVAETEKARLRPGGADE